MDTVTATAMDTTLATALDTTDTTARGPLMLSPRLRPLPLLSPATDTTAMDTVMVWVTTATATTDTAMVCTTARGPLSPATDTTAMDTATDTATTATATVLTVTATTDTVTDTATATTDKKFHSEVVQFRVQYKNKHKKLDHSVLVLNC